MKNIFKDLNLYISFLKQVFYYFFYYLTEFKLILKNAYFIGNKSILIILATSIVTSITISLHLYDFLKFFFAESLIGAAVSVSLAKSLGPIMVGFFVTAKAGASMTAEIASMKIDEQITTLKVMSVNPINYIVIPKIIASSIMTSFLMSIFMLAGSITSYIITVFFLKIDGAEFLSNISKFILPRHITEAILKSFLFGFILSYISCFKGLNAKNNAKGIGEAVTEAVVESIILIIIADFIFTILAFFFITNDTLS